MKQAIPFQKGVQNAANSLCLNPANMQVGILSRVSVIRYIDDSTSAQIKSDSLK